MHGCHHHWRRMGFTNWMLTRIFGVTMTLHSLMNCHCGWLSRSVPPDKERDPRQVRLGPASRPGPQPVSNSDRGWFMGVSLVRFKLREGSSLSMGNYIHEWGCHKSDFHKVTQYGSKMCHAIVTGVTCDTASRQL